MTTAWCPVGRALLGLWQTDTHGSYDNQGFRLRGHRFSDAEGRYSRPGWTATPAVSGDPPKPGPP